MAPICDNFIENNEENFKNYLKEKKSIFFLVIEYRYQKQPDRKIIELLTDRGAYHYRQTDRLTDSDAYIDRQTYIQTDRDAYIDRQTYIQTDRDAYIDRQSDRQIDRQTEMHILTDRQTEMHVLTDRPTYVQQPNRSHCAIAIVISVPTK